MYDRSFGISMKLVCNMRDSGLWRILLFSVQLSPGAGECRYGFEFSGTKERSLGVIDRSGFHVPPLPGDVGFPRWMHGCVDFGYVKEIFW